MLLSLIAAISQAADSWPRFRGPNGCGECEDKGIPEVWGDRDYLWKVELPGVGHSSPVVEGKQVFVTVADEEKGTQTLLCLRVADGSTAWKAELPGKVYKKNALNSFAAATPALDARHVFVPSTTPEEYTIIAFDRQSGDIAWRRNLGPFASEHGFGASPIVFEDMLIVPNDQDGASSVIALDCRTGVTQWNAPRRSKRTAYSTPIIYSHEDGRQELILTSLAHGITSLDPHTGKLNWELPVMKLRTVGSPVVAGGLIFAASGEGGGGKQMFAVRPADATHKETAVAYEVDAKLPYVVTPVAKGNLLFLWTDQGIVSCLDIPTGKRLWQEKVGGKYYGSPIRVRDKIYCVSREGNAVIIAAADKYKLIGQVKLGAPSQSTPAVADGVLYLRTQTQLLAVGKRGQ